MSYFGRAVGKAWSVQMGGRHNRRICEDSAESSAHAYDLEGGRPEHAARDIGLHPRLLRNRRRDHEKDIGAPRFPPSDPARAQILRVEPQRAHGRLGDIVVDASTDPAPPIEKIEAKLRDEAGKLGADAVVVVYDRVQPTAAYVSGPLWDRSIQAVTGRKVVGVAIKYRP